MFWKTLLHEFPIYNNHSELYLLFSQGEIVLALAEASPIKIESYYYYLLMIADIWAQVFVTIEKTLSSLRCYSTLRSFCYS